MSWGTIIFWCLICGAGGAAIAQAKNHRAWEGFLCGALLGVIGIIIVAFWKKIPPPMVPLAPPGWYVDPDGSGHRYWDGHMWTALTPMPTPVEPPRW